MKPQPFTPEDPFLAQLDGMAAQLQALRAEYLRMRAAQLENQEGLIDAARRLARSDGMTCREVAEFLGISERAVQQGIAGTACLFRAKISNGRKVQHSRLRVELHRRNQIERGKCGDCDSASLERLRLVN